MKNVLLYLFCLLPLSLLAQFPELLLQTQHPRSVEQIAYSDDGRYFATTSADGLIYLWDAISNLQLHHLQVGTSAPVELCFIPATHHLLVNGENQLWKINAADGQKQPLSLSFPGSITALAIAPNGQQLALAFDVSPEGKSIREIRVWDLNNQKWLARHRQKDDYANNIEHFAFSRDSKTLYASGQIPDILEWPWEDKKAPKTLLPLQLMSQEALSVSPSGKKLAFVAGALGAPTIGIWDTERGAFIHQFPFPVHAALNQLSFSPDGQYLIAAFQKGTYDATGFYEATQTQGYLVGYDLNKFSEIWRKEQNGGFLNLAAEPGTFNATAVEINRGIQSFHFKTGKKIRDYGTSLTALNSLAIDSTQNLLWVGGESGNINGWSLTEGLIRQQRQSGFDGKIHAIGLSQEDRKWAVASGRRVQVYNRFNQLLDEFSIEKGQVHRLLFTHDGSELAVIGTNQFEVFTNALQLLEGLNSGQSPEEMQNLYTNPVSLTIRNINARQTRAWSPTYNYPGQGTEIQMHPVADHLLMAGEQGVYIFDLVNEQLIGPEPLHQEVVTSSAFSPQGNYLATGGLDDFVSLIDLSTGEPYQIQDVQQSVNALAFSPDDQQLAIADGNTIQLWQLQPFAEGPECQLKTPATYLQFTPDGKHLIAAGPEIGITLWEVQSAQQIATMVPVGQSDFLTYTSDGYYRASKEGTRGAAFRKEGQAYTFDQFDRQRNRPDKVLQALNHPNTPLIDAYHQAYLLRNKTEEPPVEGFDIPNITHLELTSPRTTTAASATIRLTGKSTENPLQEVLIEANGVPQPPIALTKGNEVTSEIVVPLISGDNHIQIAVTDVNKSTSLKRRIQVYKEAPDVKPRLFFLGMGSNDFPKTSRPLEYAEKDVRDVLAELAASGQYAGIDSMLLLGAHFTKAKMKQARTFLEQAGPEDRIVLMASSHGLQGPSGTFYLATHDTDFSAPAEQAITFSALDSLLTYLPCPRKLLLLDACHTGEATNEELTQTTGGIQLQTFAGKVTAGLLTRTDFELMKDLFVDLRRHSGAFVISAAARGQASVENPDYQNGVFTYVVKRTIRQLADEELTVSMLQEAVAEKVPELTDGAQQPAFRQENSLWDWSLW